jgi:hypothetical protein
MTDTKSEVFRKAVALRHLNLPSELIPSILDHAECYYRVFKTQTREVAGYYNMNNSGSVIVTASLPKDIAPTSLRRIIFTTVSHDQGFSWDRPNHGTYGGSWTWFGVISGDESVLTDPGFRKEGRKIISNLHASFEYRTHTVVWECDDEEPEIQEVFKDLRQGKSVAITACAAFPAWENSVLLAKIDFDVQPVRKM